MLNDKTVAFNTVLPEKRQKKNKKVEHIVYKT